MDFHSPRISIVTPSFNSAKFVEDAIQSVLLQNYPNFEHIIVDGGSNDGTVEILKKYPHLKWIFEPDEGQSDALNKGFKYAQGDIIGWLNADDYYLGGAFKKIIEFFKSNSSVDIVYGNCHYVDENGRIFKEKITVDFDLNMLIFICYIPSTTLFFKSEIIKKDKIFLDKNFHYTMDKEYFLRLATNNKQFKYLPEFLSAFRWHNSQKSTAFHHKQSEESQIISKKYIKYHHYKIAQYVPLSIMTKYYMAKHNLIKRRKVI